ncbi:hypothetical protein EDI_142120 [Entamoeba dispar SAW760]|uniref:Uncharacterized protein n=1 Tax=Entamoeba dispar (strain ATCC PRA-260 / SAW760) TaxID=370354 RepID=B0E7H2_ENTDS|nr:uncharacterized protein EDI_142120 [Entamoeba dispar SAW760]EDR29522.1 hypothetical protein EDI_142120 [Entamoeba dispar SAW760]|eukprot:EDR29522.1 hypothetical protein EDI_142120 [Entamoeba dispar SAW760]
MDRMDNRDALEYAAKLLLEDIKVNVLLDFHNVVKEVKNYCMDLLDCFDREHRFNDEDLRYADLCAKETEIIEDMELVLKKVVEEYKETMKAIKKLLLRGIENAKVKKESK